MKGSDGNAAFAALARHGWRDIPATVEALRQF
jgi:hypothetical protein